MAIPLKTRLRAVLLTVGFLCFLSMIFVSFGFLAAGGIGMLVGIILAAIFLATVFWLSDRFILVTHQCKEIEPQESNGLYEMVERLAQRAAISTPKVYLIPDHSPNSFAVGRNQDHASIAITHGLLGILNHHELEAVLAHEIGHIKNRDLFINTVAASVAHLIFYPASLGTWAILLGTPSQVFKPSHKQKTSGFRFLLTAALTPLSAGIIRLTVNESREHMADEVSAQLCGNPQYLASALRKIQGANSVTPAFAGGPTTAHLYVVNPFSGSAVFNIFSTHPPLEDRIGRLLAMRTE